MDREKVIENLERMLSNYDTLDDIVINKNNEMLIFHRAVAKSALALLKEQETETIECEMCGHRLQTDWNWCPWCRWEMARRSVK